MALARDTLSHGADAEISKLCLWFWGVESRFGLVGLLL